MQLSGLATRGEEKRYFHPLVSGVVGMMLLLPAGFFLLALSVRVLAGVKSLYYWISPSFLQSPFDIMALHKAQFILGCLAAGILCNMLTVFHCRLTKMEGHLRISLTYRRYWLNTAIVLQGSLMLMALLAYTLIQHIRY